MRVIFTLLRNLKKLRRGSYCAHFKAEKMRKQLDKCLGLGGHICVFRYVTMVTITKSII